MREPGLDPGRRLRHIRERLGLKYRDVEESTQDIARLRGSQEFAVGLSRLADIENRGTVPSIYRLYSLCAVYALSFESVLGWFGIDLSKLPSDTLSVPQKRTHPMDTRVRVLEGELPSLPADPPRQTSYISREFRKWGKIPAALLKDLDVPDWRYALIGADDWSMFPLLRPGAFLQIDESRRRIDPGPWASEIERPIYLVETRLAFHCGWCFQKGKELTVQFHPASATPPETCHLPEEAEIIGQVVAVAMRLDEVSRRRRRS